MSAPPEVTLLNNGAMDNATSQLPRLNLNVSQLSFRLTIRSREAWPEPHYPVAKIAAILPEYTNTLSHSDFRGPPTEVAVIFHSVNVEHDVIRGHLDHIHLVGALLYDLPASYVAHLINHGISVGCVQYHRVSSPSLEKRHDDALAGAPRVIHGADYCLQIRWLEERLVRQANHYCRGIGRHGRHS